ncbi:MAG: hypothetical protein M3R47_10915 [Chloroflexota bacterium]|nr:hypothetical protein [Chloroflexota bacterium]
MESRRLTYSFSNAVTDLQNAGFQAESKSYGFSVMLQDSKTNYFIPSGHEHKEGISIPVDSGKPPVKWFIRPTI